MSMFYLTQSYSKTSFNKLVLGVNDYLWEQLLFSYRTIIIYYSDVASCNLVCLKLWYFLLFFMTPFLLGIILCE